MANMEYYKIRLEEGELTDLRRVLNIHKAYVNDCLPKVSEHDKIILLAELVTTDQLLDTIDRTASPDLPF